MHNILIKWMPNTYLQSRIFFDKRWSRIAPIMNAGVSKVATGITVTGTLLLWSNSFHNTAIGIKKIAERLGFNLELGWFDTSFRLKMIYYGGVALLVAWGIYKFRCPAIIQRHPVAEDYLREQQQIHDDIGYGLAEARASTFVLENPFRWSTSAPMGVGRVMTAAELSEALHATQIDASRSIIFRAVHLHAQVEHPYSFWACAIIGGGGFLSTIFPSVEVFWQVTRRLFL